LLDQIIEVPGMMNSEGVVKREYVGKSPSFLASLIGVTVPESTKADAVVNVRKIPGGLHAVFHCKLGKKDFNKAYSYAYGKWLPENGFLPLDRPAYDVYLKDGRKDGIFEYEICVPIEKY